LLRVLVYNHASELSGGERSLLSVFDGLPTGRYDVLLAAPEGPLLAAARERRIPVMPTRSLEIGYTRNPIVLAHYVARILQCAWALRRAIRSAGPDVVHANSVRSTLVATLAVHTLRHRPVLVAQVHDLLHKSVANRLVRRIIRSADIIIAVSACVARCVGGSRTRVLLNAIDPDRFRRDASKGSSLRSQLGVPMSAPVLATIGQLTPWKGHMDALEAFAKLRVRCADAHLLIAGSTKFTGKHRRYDTLAYAQQLKNRASLPDLAGHVHFVGEVEDTVAVYSAADLLVVPSWEEPFGLVVIEAMAAGCAVVGTNSGGIPEIITHGVDGWLVKARDPIALATVMQLMVEDPMLRSRLSTAGMRTIATRFSLTQYVEALERIWSDSLHYARMA
jgi:glycosyltransferase involved in cell wall biosynthesis